MPLQLYKAGTSPAPLNDGTSPNGLFLAQTKYRSSISAYVTSIYKWNGATAAYELLIDNLYQFSNAGSTSIFPNSTFTKWSANSNYLVLYNINGFGAPKLLVFKRDGDTFTQLGVPSSLPVDYVTDAVWNPVENSFILWNPNTHQFYLYKVGNDDVVSLAQSFTGLSWAIDCKYSPDGLYISFAGFSAPYLSIYKKSGSTYSQLVNPSGITSTVSFVAWSPDGNYLAASVPANLRIYKVDGGSFTFLTTFALNTGGSVLNLSCEWSPDSQYLFTFKNNNTSGTAPGWTLIQRIGDVFNDLGSPSGAVKSNNYLQAHFVTSSILVVSKSYNASLSASPQLAEILKVYQIDGGTVSELSNPLTETPTLPASGNLSAALFTIGNGANLEGAERLLNIYFWSNDYSLTYSWIFFPWHGEGLFAKLEDVTVQFNRMSALTAFLSSDRAKLASGLDQSLYLDGAAANFNYGAALFAYLNDAIAAFSGDGAQQPGLPNPVTSPYTITHMVDFPLDGQGVFFGGFTADDDYLLVNLWFDPYLAIYKRDGNAFTLLENPLDTPLPPSTFGAALSRDGNYLALSFPDAPLLLIYKRNGDIFELLDSPLDVQPDDQVYNLAWSPDSNYLAGQEGGTNGVRLISYKRDGDTFTLMPQPEQPSLDASGIAWSPDSAYLAVASQNGPDPTLVMVYKVVDDALQLVATPSVDGIAASSPSWDSTGKYLVIANIDYGAGVSNPYMVFKRDGDSFSVVGHIRVPSAEIQPGTCQFSPTLPLVAIGNSNANIETVSDLEIWAQNGSQFAPVSGQPDGAPTFDPQLILSVPTVAFGEGYMAVGWVTQDPNNDYQIGAKLSIYRIGQAGPPGGSFALFSSLIAGDTSDAQTSVLRQLFDSIGVSDDPLAMIEMVEQLFDGAVADMAIGALLRKTVIVIDNPQINAEVSAQLTAQARARDCVEVNAVLVIEGIPFAAWVVDRNSGAASEYQNWNFDSMCRLGDRYYGANEEGLFLLDGDDDAGDPIAASFKTGDLDFGSPQIKKPLEAHIGYTTKGDMVLKVTVAHEGKRTEFWYRCKDPVHGTATEARVPLGKGMQSRHWQFELVNTNGADFEFESIHLQMLELSRRL